MAGHITVDGRDYPTPDSFKLGEARLIKQIGGVGMNELGDALERGDPDVIAALVLIVMRRAGRKIELEQIDQLDITQINFGGDEEDEDVPPADAAPAADGSSATTPPASGSLLTAPTSP